MVNLVFQLCPFNTPYLMPLITVIIFEKSTPFKQIYLMLSKFTLKIFLKINFAKVNLLVAAGWKNCIKEKNSDKTEQGKSCYLNTYWSVPSYENPHHSLIQGVRVVCTKFFPIPCPKHLQICLRIRQRPSHRQVTKCTWEDFSQSCGCVQEEQSYTSPAERKASHPKFLMYCPWN